MKVIGCQLDVVWENKPANLAKVREMLQNGQVPAGGLLVLPEMFATGFSMSAEQICEEDPSPTEEFLATTAAQHNIYVLAGLPKADAAGARRNEAVVFSPAGKLLTRYAKMRTFTPGGESEYYQPGEQIATFNWHSMMVAPFICYDLRFPELFRQAVREGAQCLIVIANWPAVRIEHWTTLLRARAIENQAYVVGINRCGKDPQHSYNGRSLIVDPLGQVLAQAADEEGIVSADLDLEALQSWRRQFPVLGDMREVVR